MTASTPPAQHVTVHVELQASHQSMNAWPYMSINHVFSGISMCVRKWLQVRSPQPGS